MSYILSLLLFISPIWPLGDNPRVGDPYLIINKANNKIAYIDNGKIQGIYPVATGKSPTLTPEGEFNITVKAKNPYYRKKNIPGGDPRNPLGTRWIGFDALDTDGRIYGVHGTNNPSSIGKYITEGCVRMRKKDVEYLYDQIPLGAKVLIVKSPKSFEQLAREKGAIQ
ncbi:L,D-transpeptidase [Priestia taiwanensis]|nr:L,D-transpeptidase [Priestia taiwanensis]